MFSEIAEIALVAARLGQFLQFLKTRVILILNFTRPMRLHILIKGGQPILMKLAAEVGLDETFQKPYWGLQLMKILVLEGRLRLK